MTQAVQLGSGHCHVAAPRYSASLTASVTNEAELLVGPTVQTVSTLVLLSNRGFFSKSCTIPDPRFPFSSRSVDNLQADLTDTLVGLSLGGLLGTESHLRLRVCNSRLELVPSSP